jgi:hypothetical protein
MPPFSEPSARGLSAVTRRLGYLLLREMWPSLATMSVPRVTLKVPLPRALVCLSGGLNLRFKKRCNSAEVMRH